MERPARTAVLIDSTPLRCSSSSRCSQIRLEYARIELAPILPIVLLPRRRSGDFAGLGLRPSLSSEQSGQTRRVRTLGFGLCGLGFCSRVQIPQPSADSTGADSTTSGASFSAASKAAAIASWIELIDSAEWSARKNEKGLPKKPEGQGETGKLRPRPSRRRDSRRRPSRSQSCQPGRSWAC